MAQAREFDQNIQDEMGKSVAGIRPSEQLKARIIQDIREEREGYKMKKWNHSIKRLAVVTAALCFIIPTTVIASGKITSLVSKSNALPLMNSYSDVAKLEKDLGYSVKTVEKFSNGLTFKQMELMDTAALDDEGNEVGGYKQISIHYKSEDGISLTSYAGKPLTSEEAVGAADSKSMVEGISVEYTEDDYKFVPVDYEVTPEEQEAMDKGEIYISYGSDNVELSKVQHAEWVEDGVSYSIMASDTDMTAQDFFQMAGEIIRQ